MPPISSPPAAAAASGAAAPPYRLGRADVLPVADFGIKKGFARVFHRGKRKEELPTEADLVRRGERWRPFRSVASWYLWRAADGK